jgi:hypothetical protein
VFLCNPHMMLGARHTVLAKTACFCHGNGSSAQSPRTCSCVIWEAALKRSAVPAPKSG